MPGLDLGGAGRDVDVERESGGGEQADRAEEAGVGALVGDQPAAAQRVVGVVERAERVGVGGVLGRAAARAEATGQRSPRRRRRPRWAGGRRGAARRRPGRRRGAARAGSARGAGPCRRGSSPAGRGGVVRSMVTMSEPREVDGQPVAVTGGGRVEGHERRVGVVGRRAPRSVRVRASSTSVVALRERSVDRLLEPVDLDEVRGERLGRGVVLGGGGAEVARRARGCARASPRRPCRATARPRPARRDGRRGHGRRRPAHAAGPRACGRRQCRRTSITPFRPWTPTRDGPVPNVLAAIRLCVRTRSSARLPPPIGSSAQASPVSARWHEVTMTFDVHQLDVFVLVGAVVTLAAILAVRVSAGAGLPVAADLPADRRAARRGRAVRDPLRRRPARARARASARWRSSWPRVV